MSFTQHNILLFALILSALAALPQSGQCADLIPTISDSLNTDNTKKGDQKPNETFFNHFKRRQHHSIAFEGRFSGLSTYNNPFMTGNNHNGTPISKQVMANLKYSFQPRQGTSQDVLYGSPYQGFGVFYSNYFHKKDFGNPWGIYLFQGARIVGFSPRLSLNYEWNFGFSGGWVPYNLETNPKNDIVGSKINAYLSGSLYLNWIASKYIDLSIGVAASHYSNGNTNAPNRGVNMLSGTVGAKYYFNRDYKLHDNQRNVVKPKYEKGTVHEILLFASWKRVTLDTLGTNLETPYFKQKFLVAGLSYSPMYALGRKVRLGASFDLSYDQSNDAVYDIIDNQIVYTTAPFIQQFSLGLAGKIDFTMPYFTISGSLGYDVIHSKNSKGNFYQTIALKFDVVSGIYANIGYKAINFKSPDFLMLGIGVKFGRGTQYQL